MRQRSVLPSSSFGLLTILCMVSVGTVFIGTEPQGVMAFQLPISSTRHVQSRLMTPVLLSSSPEETSKETDKESSPATETAPATAMETAATTKEEVEESADYPIDVPSPILLASSMVIAIASTGSLFELIGGTPQLGFAPTAAIVALGFPTTLFLFYASIRKAIAETEEDDKRFLSGR